MIDPLVLVVRTLSGNCGIRSQTSGAYRTSRSTWLSTE